MPSGTKLTLIVFKAYVITTIRCVHNTLGLGGARIRSATFKMHTTIQGVWIKALGLFFGLYVLKFEKFIINRALPSWTVNLTKKRVFYSNLYQPRGHYGRLTI